MAAVPRFARKPAQAKFIFIEFRQYAAAPSLWRFRLYVASVVLS